MGRFGSRSRSRSPRRQRERERERERNNRRKRSKERGERDRDRERKRERDGRKRFSRSHSRSRSSSYSRSNDKDRKNTKVTNAIEERPSITQADLEGKTPDEQQMMRMMGFCNFDTTKNKKVNGNDTSAVHVILKRKYRQYMNRKGGFNRPLDFVA